MERLNAFMCNPGNFGDKEIAEQWPCFPSKYLHWTPYEMQDIAIWIDCWDSPCIEDIKRTDIKYKIAVLVEPRVLASWHYQFVLDNEQHFDLIFSTYQDFGSDSKNPNKFKKFPGGARTLIRKEEWNIYPKTKNISSIMSNKKYMPGHVLRHDIRGRHDNLSKSFIDYVNPDFYSKFLGLKDYRFELIIENEDDEFFSEKLLDSMLCGCIPIYWTNKDTSYLDMFDKDGIVLFKDADDLFEKFLNGMFTEDFYNDRMYSIRHNFEEAKKYISLGDMLWENGIKDLIGTK
jgi:hypothetical protein